MAEIKIEKKKPIWPWILAALAVLLILFLIFSGSGDDEMEDTTTTTDTTEVENDTWDNDTIGSNTRGNEVDQYVTYIRTDSDERMGLQHNYTETALERLRAAVEAKADETNADIEDEMDRIEGVADYMNEDTYKTQHADSLRVAFQQITNSIEKIQQQQNQDQTQNQNSNVDVEGLRERADALRSGQQTLNQKDEVQGFFDKAADVLQQLDRNMAQNQDTNRNQMNQNTNQTQGTTNNRNRTQN